MLAQLESADILGETPYGSRDPRDPKDLLQKFNLSEMEEWEPQLQQMLETLHMNLLAFSLRMI